MKSHFAHVWPFCVIGAIAAGGVLGVAGSPGHTDRVRDGLVGQVRQVVTTNTGTSTTKTYDRSGALLEAMTRIAPPPDQPDLGERLEKVVYIYDTQGRRMREMIEDGDGLQYVSQLYAYDARGRKVAEAAYHICGTFSSLKLYFHDGSGRVLEDLSYQFRSLIKHMYEFGSSGKVATRQTYKNGALIASTRYRYDEQSRVAEQSDYESNGALVRMINYQYDERGNPTLEETINPADPSLNAKSISTYEFDEKGNWIKRTVQRPVIPRDEDGKPIGEPSETTQRTITYFETP